MKSIRNALFTTLFIFVTFSLAAGGSNSQAENIKLSWWMPGSNEGSSEAWTSIKNMYTTESGVEVEYALIPWADYFTKLNTSFAGGLAPDVYGLGYGQMGPVQENGHTLALDDYLEGWDGWDDIADSVLQASEKDGRHWSIMMPDVKMLFYRRDIFEQRGLTPPVNTDELLELARSLTDAENNFIGFELSTSNGEQDFFMTYLMFGGRDFWDDQYRPTYNSPLGIQTMDYLKTYITEGLSVMTDEHSLVSSPFKSGYAAMSMTATDLWTTLPDHLTGKVGMAVPPGGVSNTGATFIAVKSQTQHVDEAVDLLKAIFSPEGQKAAFFGEARTPSRASLRGWFLEQHEYGEEILTSLETCRPYGPMNPYFFDFLNTFRPALEKVYYEKSSAPEAFAEAESTYLGQIK